MTRTYPKIQKSWKVSNNGAKMSKVSMKKVMLECWRNWRIIFYTIQNVEKLHLADLKNTAIQDYNSEVLQEYRNTANPYVTVKVHVM